MTRWSFLTNHGRALLCIAHDPEIRLKDIASELGITERRAHGIVNDLSDGGYVIKERDGRRNRYEIQDHLPIPGLEDTMEPIGEILRVLTGATTKSMPTDGDGHDPLPPSDEER